MNERRQPPLVEEQAGTPASAPGQRDAGPGALPNLVVIGAMKCGTTSLHRYLDLHPEVAMSRPKELNFFFGGSWGTWSRGVEWYSRQFDATAPIRGESSVNYSGLLGRTSTVVATRMASLIPDAKLIYMVRDPIDRAVSHYLHARGAGRERRPIAEALSDPDTWYVQRSLYHAALAPFLERYPRSSLLIETQEDLYGDRRATMRRVFAFLGVDEDFSSPQFERLWETTRGKDRKYTLMYRATRRFGGPAWARLPTPLRWVGERIAHFPVGGGVEPPPLDDELRARLVERFRPDTEALRRLSGRDLAGWSV